MNQQKSQNTYIQTPLNTQMDPQSNVDADIQDDGRNVNKEMTLETHSLLSNTINDNENSTIIDTSKQNRTITMRDKCIECTLKKYSFFCFCHRVLNQTDTEKNKKKKQTNTQNLDLDTFSINRIIHRLNNTHGPNNICLTSTLR